MVIAIWLVIGAAIFALGIFFGKKLVSNDTSEIDAVKLELVHARRESGVLIQVLESVGIQFNRDNDRNVVGLVHDVTAVLHGVAEMGG